MARLPRPVVERVARYAVKPVIGLPPRPKRVALEALARISVVPGGASTARQARGGVHGEVVAPDGHADAPRILYLHGGAYEWGSPRTHRHVTATIALSSRHALFVADYRLAPEHPAPAALDDAVAVYEAMVADGGEGVALAGDSAGGGLALALAVAARDRDLPAPACLALISPWVDLTMSGESVHGNARTDALLSPAAIARSAHGYVAELGADHPICSPIRADLAGLPPTLIHTGAGELFLSEDLELARRAEAAGVEVALKVFDGLWHAFHAHTGMLAEADEALAELGEFLAARLTEASPARS